MKNDIFGSIKYDEHGLVPAIIQDYMTGEVLMLAYMSEDTLKQTVDTGYATFWSRSRKTVWVKGTESGNKQRVMEIVLDCDGDTLLVKVDQIGGIACHTGERSCFFRKIEAGRLEQIDTQVRTDAFSLAAAMFEDYNTVCDRKKQPKEGSYTNYLLDKGLDKILKKVGEESAEVIIASKNKDYDEIRYEVADLLYHLTVLLVEREMSWDDIMREIIDRRR